MRFTVNFDHEEDEKYVLGRGLHYAPAIYHGPFWCSYPVNRGYHYISFRPFVRLR